MTIGGSNAGETPLETLTIREPSTGEFDERLEFTGFTSAVQFPQGATGATLTLVYLDKNGVKQTITETLEDGLAFPGRPADFGTLQSFEIAYTSDSATIIAGAESTIGFGVTAREDLEKDVKIKNEIVVTGTVGDNEAEAKADDTLTIDEKRLELETQKEISPGTIWGYEGEVATIQLPTKVKERPDSTTNAQTITVNDPELGADGKPVSSDWWDHFRPTAITKSDIPGGATLTVRYFSKDTQTWVDLVVDVAGPEKFSYDIPVELRDDIAGLQFVFTNETEGFAPGAAVQPNITTELKESLPPKPEGSDIQVKNCSSASAEAPGATAGAATVNPCPEIKILAPTPGEYDLLTKRWIDPADQLVTARSGDHATSRLSWSTSGLSGVRVMELADTRTGAGANAKPSDDVENTTYQAFDLFAVGPITAEMDPYLQYDKITAVELWNGSTWVRASNATQPSYTGSLPKIELTAAERASTTGVRLLIEENAEARAASEPIDAPAVGSGVARSVGNDRKLDLEWELRDTTRVGGTPVLGSDFYNTITRGDVNNIASAEATMDGESFRDEDSDLISILDRPLNVNFAKSWTGGPLGVPVTGTPAADYPSGRVTLVATNTTVAKVDTMKIVDAKTGGASPFDVFNVKKIVSISNNVPGADPAKTRVLLTHENGAETTHTPGQASGLSVAELADVIRIEVVYEGRILSGAKATVQMDMQLRPTHRDGGAPVTTVDSPVRNDAVGIVEDAGGVLGIHHVEADDDAQIVLESLNIGVLTTKSFDPSTQYATRLPGETGYDEELWDPITMTLSARPSGSARPAEMVVTDDTATFWNAYRFEGFAANFALAAPIERVQVDALVGGTFVVGDAASLSLDGASWVSGTAAATPALPAGVTPDQVQGLRFTFTKADGTQWENPANPKQEIPLTVKRRAYLESAPLGSTHPVPVPWNGAVGAPGEPGGVFAKGGRFTNTVDADVTSAVKNPANLPLTAHHSTTTQVFYEAGGTEISVVKSPIGAQAPGQIIPFTLTVKNTSPLGSGSNFAILDPVVTDHLPLDADDNPLLVFDPESSEPKYSYALVPGDAPNDPTTTIPTDPKRVKVKEYLNASGEPTNLEFTFPKDTVLMPGDSYTITINMMFRPGVKAGERITNKFDVSAALPFSFCNGKPYEGAGSGFFECDDDTEVYPTEIGALRGQKFVKADDTELGVTNVANPAASSACKPTIDDENGKYFSGDCVPITKPLGTETWRERVQNTGTVEMDKVVTIDRLPTPGDQGALVLLPRDSQWAPKWTGPITPVEVDGYRVPDSVAYFYSSAKDPCVADLHPAEDACPAGTWLPLTAEVDPASVKHIKTEFGFATKHFMPGDVLGYTFQTRTPAVSAKPTKDTVAWNTIAIGAETVTTEGDKLGEVLPTEGRRVGVALASGPLKVEKIVTGPGAEAFAPATFKLQVECTVTAPDGSGLTEVLPPITIKQEIEPGKPVTIAEQLPWGAKCQVLDVTGANGETSSQPGEAVTIGRDKDPVPVAQLTNTYALTSVEVAKNVVGATGIDYGEFPVAASCSFMGEELALDPAETTLTADGNAWLIPDLPVGAECTLTELDAHGASAELTLGGEPLHTNEDGSWTFTVPETDAGKPLALSLVNTFETGQIALKKTVNGPGAAAVSDDTAFTFAVECTFNGATVYDKTITLTKGDVTQEAADTLSFVVNDLPVGAECGVTETGTGGATETNLSPEKVTVEATTEENEQTINFTAVNTYDAGSLHVAKEITGAGAELYGAGPFEVSLACTLDGTPVDVPEGATRVLSTEGGLEADYPGLPLGAQCELTETKTGGATSSEIVDADGAPVTEPVVIGSDEDLSLRVINTFDIGSITVEKQITGAGASLANDKAFTVALACTIDRDGTAAQIEIPGGADRELSKQGGLTTSYDDLPVGAECELRETANGGAAGVTITPNSGDTSVGTVTVAKDTAAAITVVNEFAAPPVVPPTEPPTKPGTKPGGGLPTTGGGSNLGWLIGGGALLLVGAALIALRLRRRGSDAAEGTDASDTIGGNDA